MPTFEDIFQHEESDKENAEKHFASSNPLKTFGTLLYETKKT